MRALSRFNLSTAGEAGPPALATPAGVTAGVVCALAALTNRATMPMAIRVCCMSTIGTPDVCQVTCIRRVDDYAVRFSTGPSPARLNGAVLGETPVRLYDRDVLELGANRLRFQIQDSRPN